MSRKGIKLTLVEIIEQIRNRGFVERTEEIIPGDKVKARAKNIFFIENVHACPDFTGREREIETLSRWMQSEDGSVFVIHGIAGIGKTSLGYILASRAREKSHLFWYTCEEWTSQRAIATSLGEFLNQMGEQDLSSYLGGTIEIDLTTVYKCLEEVCKRNNILLIMDDTQKLDKKENSICQILIKLATSIKSVRLLVLSRKIPGFYSPKDVLLKGKVKEMRLEGLAFEECTSLLARWGVIAKASSSPSDTSIAEYEEKNHFADPSFETDLYQVTRGHPLALELARGRKVEKDIIKDITRFFREEVLRTISTDKERMLELAAVYRSSIPSTGLFLEEGNYHTLDSLIEQNLIKETQSGYAIHDVLRGVMVGRSVPKRKKTIHKLIADHLRYEAQTGNISLALESCHHYLETRDLHEAIDVILEFGVPLFSEGFLYEVLVFIDRLIKGDDKVGIGSTKEKRVALLCLKGNLLTFTGELNDAKRLLDEVVGCKELENKHDIVYAKAQNGLGIIAYKNRHYELAINHYREATTLSRECDNPRYTAKVLSNLGVAHADMGELELARNAHLESMELCWEMDDKEGLARAYNNLGIISFMKNEIQEAILMFKKGLDIARVVGKVHISAIALNNLGEAYGILGDRKKAKNYYKEGLKLSKKYGFVSERAEALEGLRNMVDA